MLMLNMYALSGEHPNAWSSIARHSQVALGVLAVTHSSTMFARGWWYVLSCFRIADWQVWWRMLGGSWGGAVRDGLEPLYGIEAREVLRDCDLVGLAPKQQCTVSPPHSIS